MHNNIKTSQQLTLLLGEGVWTSLQEDFPASRSASPASVKARPMTVISGRRCCEQFERYDRAGSWAKTFTELLIGRVEWYSSKCALIWKMQATPSKRMLFRLVPSMLPTDAIGHGLLPTPAVMEDRRIPNGNPARTRKIMSNLNPYSAMALLPTVQTQGLKVFQNGQSRPIALEMLPTPTAIDSGSGRVNRSQSANAPDRPTLALAARRGLLPTPTPTPTATDDKRGVQNEHQNSVPLSLGISGSQLNPRFVAEMMGLPPDWTVSPFLRGADINKGLR